MLLRCSVSNTPSFLIHRNPRFSMKSNPDYDMISLPDTSEEEEDLFTTEQEEEHVINDPFQQDLSDSDSAPEILSFKSAREGSKLEKKHAAEVIRTHKDERKRKRKEIHLQNLLQKEQKRQKIASNKLPDDVLQDLDKLPDDLPTVSSVHESSELEAKEELNEDKSEKEIIIDPEPTIFKCKILSHESMKRHIPEKVANFKERALYGRRIRREKSTREFILKRARKFART